MSLWNTAHPWLHDLVSYEPGKPIEDVARELGLKPHDIIKLASNENPLGPSPKALAAMRETLERSHFYPDGGGFYLREAIAKKFGFDRSNVMLGCGSNEIIEFIGKAFLNSGDEIVTARLRSRASLGLVIFFSIIRPRSKVSRASSFDPNPSWRFAVFLHKLAMSLELTGRPSVARSNAVKYCSTASSRCRRFISESPMAT